MTLHSTMAILGSTLLAGVLAGCGGTTSADSEPTVLASASPNPVPSAFAPGTKRGVRPDPVGADSPIVPRH
jgi:hypothetical protein